MTLFQMVIGWVAGMIVAWANPAVAERYTPLAFGCALALLILAWQDRLARRIGWCLLAASLGALRYSTAQPTLEAGHIAAYNERGFATFIGVIVAPPEVRDQNTRVRLEVESVRQSGVERPAHGLALIYLPRSEGFAYGDRITVRGMPSTPPVFDTFSYRDYLARMGIYTVVLNAEASVLERGTGNPLLSTLYGLRDSAKRLLAALVQEPHASLLTGILTGDDNGISPDVQAAFRATNTSHLLAISGANFAVVTGILTRLFFGSRERASYRTMRRLPQRTLGLAYLRAAALTIVGVVLYAIFTGASPSVLRAALMATFPLIFVQAMRRLDALNALAISVWVITLLTPGTLLDYGLILSAGATFALIVYLPALTRLTQGLFKPLFSKSTAGQIAAFLADSVLMGLAVQIIVLPVTLTFDGTFALAGLVVNALVAPVQGWIMILGIAALGLGAVWVPLGQLAAWLAALPLGYTLAVIRAGALAPASVSIAPSPTAMLAYYTILLSLTYVLSKSSILRRRWFQRAAAYVTPGVALVGLGVGVLLWLAVTGRPDDRLHLWLLDVGEGDAALIQTPAGAHLLIDTGERPTSLLTALGDRLPYYKRRLDVVFITSAQLSADSAAALEALAGRYQIGQIVSAAPLQSIPGLQEVPTLSAADGQRVTTSDGTQITVWRPVEGGALALYVAQGSARLLLPPAFAAAEIEALMARREALSANVLLLPRAGAEKANPPAWLRAVSPQIVLASAQAGQRNAQPGDAVLATLAGTPLFRTDQDGTIHLVTDGAQMWIRPGR